MDRQQGNFCDGGSEKLTSKHMVNIWLTMLMALCGSLGIDIHLSSIPSIMSFMHTDKSHVQQSISIFLLGMGSSLLIYGPLSDRYGRRCIVILGLSLAAISSYLSAFTIDINAFLVMRLLQGFGSGVCIGLGRVIVADMIQGKRFAIITSYMSMFISVSPLFAPAVGSYIQHYFGWQANFITLGIILTLLLVLIIIFFTETNKYKNEKACSPRIIYENYRTLLLNPVFISYLLISGIGMSVSMVYATASPLIFQAEFHLTPIAYGWITTFVGVGGVLGKFLTPYLVRRMTGTKMIVSGLSIFLFSGLWIFCFTLFNYINPILVIVPVSIALFAQTFIFPNAAAKALSPFHDKRGAAGGLYGSFQMLIACIVSALVGVSGGSGSLALSVAYLLLGAVGLIIMYLCIRLTK